MLTAGECVNKMNAHSSAVSSLDIDPAGNFMVSGGYFAYCLLVGHDTSVRLWDIRKQTCVQDFNAHRKKFDEGVCCVRYHPSKMHPWLASSGADSLVKLYS